MSVKLRRWGWKELPVYNGFTHAERVRGWQVISWMINTGQMPKASVCCITGSTQRVGYHSENYYSWEAYPLCQSVHFALHQRFKRPDAWRKIVDAYGKDGDWFTELLIEPQDLAGQLREQHGPDVTDIFARAGVPIVYR
jgi:hypothetical protein